MDDARNDPPPASDAVDEVEEEREKANNAEAIRAIERTTQTARGNVHSECDDDAPDQDAPPPFPN